jgi:hypothetical protein
MLSVFLANVALLTVLAPSLMALFMTLVMLNFAYFELLRRTSFMPTFYVGCHSAECHSVSVKLINVILLSVKISVIVICFRLTA